MKAQERPNNKPVFYRSLDSEHYSKLLQVLPSKGVYRLASKGRLLEKINGQCSLKEIFPFLQTELIMKATGYLDKKAMITR